MTEEYGLGHAVSKFLELSDRIVLPDLRVSPLLFGHGVQKQMGRTLLEYTSELSFKSVESFCTTPDGRKLVNALFSFESMSLEAELRSVLTSVIPPNKSTLPFLSRLGWNGTKKVTLHEAGVALGLTRERVRQIQVEIEGTLKTAPVWTPVLNKVIDVIVKEAPFALSGLDGLLIENGLIEGESFDYQSLRHAIEVLAPYRLHDFQVVQRGPNSESTLSVISSGDAPLLGRDMHTIQKSDRSSQR